VGCDSSIDSRRSIVGWIEARLVAAELDCATELDCAAEVAGVGSSFFEVEEAG
jgi:hypothetical protein